MCIERKIVWVYPSENPVCCPVCIIDKYISLLPPLKPTTKKPNFYLRSLEKFNPGQWYGKQVVGLNSIRKVMSDICKKANIEGFITNHSLRRTGTTKLFCNGVDRKLIKEFTGHRSDAVDAYAVTSDKQREKISKILTGSDVKNDQKDKESKGEIVVNVAESGGHGRMECHCKKQELKLCKTEKIGTLIDKIVQAHKGGKTKIKVEIEFGD